MKRFGREIRRWKGGNRPSDKAVPSLPSHKLGQSPLTAFGARLIWSRPMMASTDNNLGTRSWEDAVLCEPSTERLYYGLVVVHLSSE